MIFDFEFLQQKRIPRVVIIGSGPAGITLSKTLASQGVDSLILEAGGLEYTELAQDTAIGTVVGDEYWDLKTSRLKYFGGTSNHWTGVCRQLDEVDFQKRSDIEGHLGWPISKSELDPYYDEARAILEIPEMRQVPVDEHIIELEFARSPPVRFGQKYLDFFKKSTKANICLNSNVVSVVARNGRVRQVIVAGPDQLRVMVEAEIFVICTGGIDNSRLLLWSNEVSPEPVVNNKHVLGKYWFEHPHNLAGEAFMLNRFNKFQFPGAWMSMTLAPSPAAMIEYKILNACLRVRNLNSFTGAKLSAWKLVCATSPLSVDALKLLEREVECIFDIEMVWEQQPRYDNKVMLSLTEKDSFDVPRPVLYWSKNGLDYRTPKVMMELFGRYLAQNDLGYVRSFDHIIEEKNYPSANWMAGHHHMGGTRMSDRAEDGVVDRNLKIFGMDNAFILGSSVFPSGGHANPTFTIVQLSLRLADYLSKAVKKT